MRRVKHLLTLLALLVFNLQIQAQLPYTEDFTGQDGKGAIGPTPTYDTTGMDWTIDVSSATLSETSDYFKVNTVSSNEIFEARDTEGEVVWKSPVIDIDGQGLIDLSVDLSEVGTMEASDYIEVYYILSGSGTEVEFTNNGIMTDDFTSVTASENAVSGTSVQIVIRIDNNADTEKHRFENISITSASGYSTPTSGDVLITEYVEHSTQSRSYLELYNTTGNPIDLSDCKIVSSGSNTGVYDFSSDIPGYAYIPANGFLILNSGSSQSNFESTWSVTLPSSVIYTRTDLTVFQNNNTFKLKQGGTVGVDDGTEIDETTEYPSASTKRVYQLPVGRWTSNENDNSNATPGSLSFYEKLDEIDLVFADGSWYKATDYAHASPSSSTGGATAVVLRGEATFVDGATLQKLWILGDAGTDITNEDVTVSSELIIQHDAALSITGTGSVTCSGTITKKRESHNANTDYNMWGSPFAGDLDITSVFTNHYNCDIYAFEASTQSWKYDEDLAGSLNCNGNMYSMTSSFGVSTTDGEGDPDGNFDIGRGYFIAGHSSNEISFTKSSAALNNGDITVKIFGSSNTPTDGSNDWNLISNPYPSGVSVTDFLDANSGSGKLVNAVYLYNPGSGMNSVSSYDTYNNTHTTRYIASCQGFYVDGNTSTDGYAYDITFTNSMRHHTNNDFRSILSYEGVYLDVVDDNGENDPLRLYFDMDAKDGYDNKYDALKLPNGDFNFCSKLDNKNLVFNGMSELKNEVREIPLYFQTTQTSNYTINLDELVGSFDNREVLLEDRFMRKFHNLKQDGYTFNSSPKEWSNRFYLHIIPTKNHNSSGNNGGNVDTSNTVTGLEELLVTNLQVFYSGSEIVVGITSGDESITNVELIQSNGKVVSNTRTNDTTVRISTNDLPTGLYLVKTYLSNDEISVDRLVVY